jgi:muramoyltetrapeptide carboxypeptidase
MPLLDYGVIRANPKIIIGYSDLTSLHCAFLAEADLVSFHGPMTNSDFIKKAMPEFTLGSFLRTLGEAKPAGSICFGYSDAKPSVVRRGVAQGALIGGNLSILCATVGTRYLPSFRDKILFLEDLDEVPYRFDRMLTHLLNARLLQQVAGVAVGINANCGDPKAGKTREYRQTVEEVIEERLGPLKVPVVIGLPFGHVPTNATLPVGIRATLDARRGDLIIEQAAVV